MLTTPKRSAHFEVQSQFLNTVVGTQLRLSASIADKPTVCLHGLQSTPFFQNLQILRTITSGHDVIHTPATFPIRGLL